MARFSCLFASVALVAAVALGSPLNADKQQVRTTICEIHKKKKRNETFVCAAKSDSESVPDFFRLFLLRFRNTSVRRPSSFVLGDFSVFGIPTDVSLFLTNIFFFCFFSRRRQDEVNNTNELGVTEQLQQLIEKRDASVQLGGATITVSPRNLEDDEFGLSFKLPSSAESRSEYTPKPYGSNNFQST